MLPQSKVGKVISNEKGFTLMEMLVVIFILGLVMSGLFATLNWNFQTAFKGVSNQKELENFRILNNHLIEDIQFAKSIVIDNKANKDTLQYVTIDNKVNILYFESGALYKVVGTEKVKITSGSAYDKTKPAVYLEDTGLVRFNFYADEIKSLMFVSIKPIIFHADSEIRN
ncbi:type II secretion system protein [Priestia filamentosa]|uniref:type II secretion system protein n=1 Tax=Priestia filamentosa TaxID=1402861 RepID=UPI000589021F